MANSLQSYAVALLTLVRLGSQEDVNDNPHLGVAIRRDGTDISSLNTVFNRSVRHHHSVRQINFLASFPFIYLRTFCTLLMYTPLHKHTNFQHYRVT